ncbi:MAG: hypothetical protein ACK559_32395, partial [bacterium]
LRSGAKPFQELLEEYPIPSDNEQLLRGGEMGQYLNDIRQNVLQYLLPPQELLVLYRKLFRQLLYIEERAVWEELAGYGLDGIKIAKEGRQFVIHVPGVAESRPSVLRG